MKGKGNSNPHDGPRRCVCAGCYIRKPRTGSRFCTNKCAAQWADDMTEGQVWDSARGFWVEEE